MVESCHIDKNELIAMFDEIMVYAKKHKIAHTKLAFMLNAVSIQIADDLGLKVQDAHEVPGDLQ